MAEPSQRIAWKRVKDHQGEVFHTRTGLPFTYEVEDDARIRFFREGRKINRALTKRQFSTAVERYPAMLATEISDLLSYAYLFGLLTDRRIRAQDW